MYLHNVHKSINCTNVRGSWAWRLGASSLEAPGLHDSNLNTLSIQTPRGQELFGHIKINKNMRQFGIAHEI